MKGILSPIISVHTSNKSAAKVNIVLKTAVLRFRKSIIITMILIVMMTVMIIIILIRIIFDISILSTCSISSA